AITRQRQLHSGSLDLSGKGSWSAEKFYSEGKAAVKNLEWQDDQLRLRDASLRTDFSVNGRQLKVTKAQGPLLGGSITGHAGINHGLPPQPSPIRSAKEKKIEEQKGFIRLRLKDVSAMAVASALSPRHFPLDRLNLEGIADGAIEARWTGAPRR